MDFNHLIRSQAATGVKRITTSIKNLEAKQAHPITSVVGSTSIPPTTSEINSIFDTPQNVGQDFIGLIKDVANGSQWLVWTDGVSWYVMAKSGTAAKVNGARVIRTTNLTLASSPSVSAIPFTSEIYDGNGYHNNVTNNTRIIIPEDGTYTITTSIAFDTDSTGIRRVLLIKDGTFNIAGNIKTPLATENTFVNVVTTDFFIAGEFIEVYVNQNSGSNLDILALSLGGISYSPIFTIVKH